MELKDTSCMKCGSQKLIENSGRYVCQHCGTIYEDQSVGSGKGVRRVSIIIPLVMRASKLLRELGYRVGTPKEYFYSVDQFYWEEYGNISYSISIFWIGVGEKREVIETKRKGLLRRKTTRSVEKEFVTPLSEVYVKKGKLQLYVEGQEHLDAVAEIGEKLRDKLNVEVEVILRKEADRKVRYLVEKPNFKVDFPDF